MQTETTYIEHNGKVCVSAPTLIEGGIMTQCVWDKCMKQARSNNYVTRPGGNGRPSLIELVAVPTKYRDKIIKKFGNPNAGFNALSVFFTLDAKARIFYDEYTRPGTTKHLEPYQISRYVTNASVLNALDKLRDYRATETKTRGNPRRDLKNCLAEDCTAFNEVLKNKYSGLEHNLPKNPRKLMDKLAQYKREGYACLIDGRADNSNAQVVTPEMIQLWNAIFAGQRYKPSHYEVSMKYDMFLMGNLEVANRETGEVYDPKAEHYKPVSDRSVYNYLAEWKNRNGVFKARAGNRKTYMDRHTPSGRMLRPSPGAIISIDDYQPPFKWADDEGCRMWFYVAQDLGSTAITTWVYGDAKGGIIMNFYRQLLRNYAAFGVKLPYELECEASLNSSFVNTFLSPGILFQKVRVLPNKPRAKRIERTIREFRLAKASKHPAFVARHTAKDENYQQRPGKQIYISKEEIVEFELRMIEEWNNELHPDQDVYPGMSRWDVFMDKQNANLKPINWIGALPHLGNCTPTSMRLGRITLQGIDRVVGIDGKVALGDTLLNIMNEIEGQEVMVHWIDDADGQVLKAHVHNNDGRFICELMDDLPYHRSELDQTEQCRKNMQLYFAYEKTVDAHANRGAKAVTPVELFENEVAKNGRFEMPGLVKREVKEVKKIEILPEINEEDLEPVYIPRKGLDQTNF